MSNAGNTLLKQINPFIYVYFNIILLIINLKDLNKFTIIIVLFETHLKFR